MNKIMNVQDIHTDDESDTNDYIDDRKSDISSTDSNAYLGQMLDKDKFKFFTNYRGKPTDKFIKSFYKLNAP